MELHRVTGLYAVGQYNKENKKRQDAKHSVYVIINTNFKINKNYAKGLNHLMFMSHQMETCP